MLADTEDMVLVGKLKDARINLDDLDNMMELGEEQVHQLEAFLDKILEKETAQRAGSHADEGRIPDAEAARRRKRARSCRSVGRQ